MLKLTAIGHVGNDARIQSHNGTTFTTFSVATYEKILNKTTGEEVERTTWVSCTHRSDKIAEYIKKGDRIYVEGKPSVRTYIDSQGLNQIGINLLVDRIEFLTSKSDRGQSADRQSEPEPDMESDVVAEPEPEPKAQVFTDPNKNKKNKSSLIATENYNDLPY